MNTRGLYDVIVMGVSAGGLAALESILSRLDESIPVPVLVVQHLSPDSDNYLPRHLDRLCRVRVKEAEDKERPERGTVYLAPPNYHLLVECGRTLALSIEERVNFSRPSVDVLFETAAEAYGSKVAGVVLTGANSDGAEGLLKIRQMGGLAIVQTPESAEADAMPLAALKALGKAGPDHLLPLGEIGRFINSLVMGEAV